MKRIGTFLLLFLLACSIAPQVSTAQVQYGLVGSAISTANSSAATLTSGSVFTGTSEDVSKYAEIRVNVISDVASATDGLSLQQSSNGTNWDHLDVFTIPLATGKQFGVPVYARYFRIVYTNGGTNQASFRLQTVYHGIRTKPSSVRPQDARTNDNDMEEVIAYEAVFNGTTWDRARSGQQAATSSRAVTLSNENVQELKVTGQSAQTATVNNILTVASGSSATDVTGYRSFSIQVVSTGSGGTYIFEGSNDNTNFQTVPAYSQLIITGTPITAAITATSSNLIYVGPINFTFIRLRIATTITGGSIQAFSRLAQTNFTPALTQVAQATAANLNATVTGTLTGVTTLANGQTAHSSASTGSPVRTGGRVLPATPDLTLVAGDASDLGITSGQQVLEKQFAPAEYDFTFNGLITNSTTAAVFKNAAGASIRNYVTGLILNSDALATATEIVIKDGAISTTSLTTNTFTSGTHDYKIGDQVIFSNIASYTGVTINTIYYILTVPSVTTYTISLTPNGAQVTGIGGTGTATSNRILLRTKLQTTSFGPTSFTFPSPLRGIPNGTMDIQTVTASVTGSVYYNVQGFIGF